MATTTSTRTDAAAIGDRGVARTGRRVTFELPWTTRDAFKIVMALSVLLVVISFTMDVFRYGFDVHFGEVLYQRLSVDREMSIQTWFDSTLLFVGALAVASIAIRQANIDTAPSDAPSPARRESVCGRR